MSAHYDSGLFVTSNMAPQWHNLGLTVQVPIEDMNDALELAGMDWRVLERPAYFLSNSGDMIRIEGHKTLVRSDNEAVLSVCKESWTVEQNEDSFRWFQPLIDNRSIELSAAISLFGGKRTAVTGKILNLEAEVVSGDPILAYIVGYNSHDGTLSKGFKFSPLRPVCQNTLEMVHAYKGKSTAHHKIRHTKGLAGATIAARELMDLRTQEFGEVINQFRSMAKVQLDTAGFNNYIADVFSDQLKTAGKPDKDPTSLRSYDQLLENFEAGKGTDNPKVRGTLWAAYNAITEWTTHQRGSDDEQGKRDRLNAIWFGSGETITIKAQSSALALV